MSEESKPTCWVKGCKEEPFLEIDEVWFGFDEEDEEEHQKFCSSKTIFREDSKPLWMCFLHYIPQACNLATAVLNYAAHKGRLGPVIPDRWFVNYNGNYMIDGDVYPVKNKEEEYEQE